MRAEGQGRTPAQMLQLHAATRSPAWLAVGRLGLSSAKLIAPHGHAPLYTISSVAGTKGWTSAGSDAGAVACRAQGVVGSAPASMSRIARI
jgi:hypothetical protein